MDKQKASSSCSSLNQEADKESADALVEACNLLADCGLYSVYSMSKAELLEQGELADKLVTKYNELIEASSDDEDRTPSRSLVATGRPKKTGKSNDRQSEFTHPLGAPTFKIPESRTKNPEHHENDDEEIEFKWKKNQQEDRYRSEQIPIKKKDEPDTHLAEDQREKILKALSLQQQEAAAMESRKLQEVASNRRSTHRNESGQQSDEEEDDDIF